ncbi:MAG: HAD hydrolase family protein [Provencibacterium sp.]|nr:HAD hydrolase family protein [Provencibacterium sp.]
MKTLYVSDLDGSLLRSDEATSRYTNNVINRLTESGAFVIDSVTEDIMIENYFDDSVDEILDELFVNKIYPIIYGHIKGKEKFSFVPELCTDGMKKFLSSRNGDIRTNTVKTANDLKTGDIFYITCISEKLKPIYDKYKDRFHCSTKNDIDMFKLADESYAVQNADEELKKYATAIILSQVYFATLQKVLHNYLSSLPLS